ncbi:hypothetical protein GCM10009720_20830 [Yaniella flava]|uniref:UPF0102 protein GCM10009720_20830 n=1 Tax=Yaniella flava TaxID=287930 RepID=A0ABN2UNX3_9MICC
MSTNSSQDGPHALGKHGEDIAVEALAGAGYQILARNWQAAAGEVDVIAYHRHHLVAIEIKTRMGTRYGTPLGSLTAYQLLRIQKGLLHYKQTVYPRFAHTPIRVDLVGVLIDDDGDVTAELLQDVT